MTDNIIFSTDPAAELKKFMSQKGYSKVAVLSDEHTAECCYPVVKDSLPAHVNTVLRSGEEHKNLATCDVIWKALTDQALDRHSVVVVIGGGVLGDMGGFCAATYKRGIDFILLPTTLLSQVDASIGGKLGVDFHHLKNHIGVFRTPALTILHSGFLKTLPAEEIRSGFAEVIKHALIADAGTWEKIKALPLDRQPWDLLLPHSVDVKRRVVEADPFEKGLRKILNAGHTIGHAVETFLLQEKRKILHGEAVAAGLVCEAFLARERDMLTENDFKDIVRYLLGVFGKVQLIPGDDDQIAMLTTQDKKNKENRILCVLLEGIGKARWDCEIRSDEVKRALSFYRSA